jgi:hypothetical protein
MPLVVENSADILALAFAQRPLDSFLEQYRVAADRAEWCAELVADHVDVAAFCFVCFLRCAARGVCFDPRAVALLE